MMIWKGRSISKLCLLHSALYWVPLKKRLVLVPPQVEAGRGSGHEIFQA